ncbi:hypothetical protein E2P81_ATG02314 [Venturia nashicola]|uniref:Uncharacterized protein n=1 Tax=Venturia nashicola TaxID=86259 RepID=A0A4Z1PF84_9PEZI|nr:hypothetical protein E6O75_ATG02371 [Venturia nashicola]TLD36532.1 hypothetical protein E2P81_ATG02314 [Venturia nashicola]
MFGPHCGEGSGRNVSHSLSFAESMLLCYLRHSSDINMDFEAEILTSFTFPSRAEHMDASMGLKLINLSRPRRSNGII